MEIALNPTIPNAVDTSQMKRASDLYMKHSPSSMTRASDVFSLNDAELVHDLKRALLIAIECGNFDKALYILKQLQNLVGQK